MPIGAGRDRLQEASRDGGRTRRLYTKEGTRPDCSSCVRTQPRSGWLIGCRLKDPSAQNAVGRLRPTHQIRVLTPAVTGLVGRWGIPAPLEPLVASQEHVVRVTEPRHGSSIDAGVARLLVVGLRVDEHGDGVEQQEECDHEERDPRVPARPGSVPLSGGSVGIEVHAVSLPCERLNWFGRTGPGPSLYRCPGVRQHRSARPRRAT